MVKALHGRGMASVNQTRPHCVNEMGKTHSKPLAARHAMCESAFSEQMSMPQRTTNCFVPAEKYFVQPVNWLYGQLHHIAGRPGSVSRHNLNFLKHCTRTCTVYLKFYGSGRKMGLIFLSHRKHIILQLRRHVRAPCAIVW